MTLDYFGPCGSLHELTLQFYALYHFIVRDKYVLRVEISRARGATIQKCSKERSLAVQVLFLLYLPLLCIGMLI